MKSIKYNSFSKRKCLECFHQSRCPSEQFNNESRNLGGFLGNFGTKYKNLHGYKSFISKKMENGSFQKISNFDFFQNLLQFEILQNDLCKTQCNNYLAL